MIYVTTHLVLVHLVAECSKTHIWLTTQIMSDATVVSRLFIPLFICLSISLSLCKVIPLYLCGNRKENTSHTRLRHGWNALNTDLYRCGLIPDP